MTVNSKRGFTLIEVMISLVVLATAILGSLSALISAGRELRDGQTRQARGLLGDASMRRWMLASKLPGSSLLTLASANPLASACVTACNTHPIGSAPWSVDPTPLVPGDLSTGAYFKVFGNGEVRQLSATTSPAVAAGTPCSSASLPSNVYCREVAFTVGASPIVSMLGTTNVWPPASGWVAPGGTGVYTVWVRLSKKGDGPNDAVYFVDSFVR